MAGRNNTTHIQRARDKIAASQLINRLLDNALAEEEFLTAGQIKSAEILIRKVIPDLKQVEQTLEVEGDIRFGWHDSHTVQSENTTGEATPEPE